MKRLYYYFIVLMAFGWYAESQARTVSETDSLALIALYKSTKGASWTNKWNLNQPVTSWHGVSVSGGKVTRLSLNSNQLSGTIPVDLGKLANLTFLSLWGNQLSGTIPAAVSWLTNLTHLNLQQNQLSGLIPVDLGWLINLTFLSLWGNQLSGPIPVELGRLTKLRILWLSRNKLSGAILVELSKLTNLTSLDLSSNQLSGSIPVDLGKLTDLTSLRLESNQLSGIIPADLGKLTNLTWLYLSSNQLSGIIPADLGKLTNLTRLYLSSNQLSGIIPVDLGKLTNLIQLSLFSNQLSGSIPADLGKLTKLTTLSLSENKLSGSIPGDLGKLTNLTQLYLSFNQLSGSIPAELGKLTNLIVLSLYSNQLSGTIPADLGKLTKLTRLFLYSNQLSSMPDLSALTKLTSFQVQNNQLDFADIIPNIAKLTTYAPQAPISKGNTYPPNTPQTFTVTTPGAGNTYQWFFNEDTLKGETKHTLTLTNAKVGYYHCEIKNVKAPALTLTSDREIVLGPTNTADSLVLVKFYNMTKGASWKNKWDLSKPVMSWYGVTVKVGRVGKLVLINNQLSGTLPAELGNLTSLTTLELGQGELTGVIPAELGKLINLTALYIYNHKLSGSIPAEIGNLTNLKSLSFRSNQLTGTIPQELGNLVNIEEFISLRNNQLTGTIPQELGRLTKMTELYLYSNQLSGNIPKELGNLSNLSILYLYANQLSGAVPEEFKNLSKLERLYLYDNKLNSLPDLSGLASLSSSTLRVQRNYLGFEDIKPNLFKINSSSFYNPQTIRDGQAYFQNVGSNLTLTVDVSGSGNTYQWYRNGGPMAGATSKALVLSNIQVANAGRYHCEVKNSSVAGLTLASVADTVVINTSPNALALSATTIAENKAIGTTIGTLTTTDATPNDKHTYTLGGVDAASFKIVGNMLQNAAVFDFEKKKSYNITITSTDRGKATISKNFTITVTDEAIAALPNNNPNTEAVIILYPNPSSGFIRFKGLDSAQPVVIQIFNSVGQLVKTYSQIRASYDLSYLTKGLYIAVVQVGSKNQTFTFILN